MLSALAWAQNSDMDQEGHACRQHALFYEIHPHSFADSNHDGIGDLPGIYFETRLSALARHDAIRIAHV